MKKISQKLYHIYCHCQNDNVVDSMLHVLWEESNVEMSRIKRSFTKLILCQSITTMSSTYVHVSEYNEQSDMTINSCPCIYDVIFFFFKSRKEIHGSVFKSIGNEIHLFNLIARRRYRYSLGILTVIRKITRNCKNPQRQYNNTFSLHMMLCYRTSSKPTYVSGA